MSPRPRNTMVYSISKIRKSPFRSKQEMKDRRQLMGGRLMRSIVLLLAACYVTMSNMAFNQLHFLFEQDHHDDEAPRVDKGQNGLPFSFADKSVPVADWEYFPTRINETSVKEPDVVQLNPDLCSDIMTLRTPKRRRPSHGACDGYEGILHIRHAGGKNGTIFLPYIIGLLLWADQHNFKPWVHFDSISYQDSDRRTRFTILDGFEIGWARDANDPVGYKFPGRPRLRPEVDKPTPKQFDFGGTGVWEHFFEPVSDFSPGDPTCWQKAYVTTEDIHVVPGLFFAPWAPDAWHVPKDMLLTHHGDLIIQVWFDSYRQRIKAERSIATTVTRRYIRFNREMEQRAACAHPRSFNSLGVLIELMNASNTTSVSDVLPYCEAFIDNGGDSIYLATDSPLVVEVIMGDWPENVTSRIVPRPAKPELGISFHRTQAEELTDALALSKCTYFLHRETALSELVFYLNPQLMEYAVNFGEQMNRVTVDGFRSGILIPNIHNTDLTAPIATWEYYPNITEQSVDEPVLNLDPGNCSSLVLNTSPPRKRTPSNGACEGYEGILHIQRGDTGGASGTIFFQFMVGFLQWADQHNFKPWVHFDSWSSKIFDPVVHNVTGRKTIFSMLDGMEVGWARDALHPFGSKFPGKPQLRDGIHELSPTEFVVEGTGVWEHYFEPVSDFQPGDPSCTNKPIVRFDDLHIVPGLHSYAPWAPHAWRYWMPKYIQRNDLTLKEWFKPQRRHASSITKRYIRFNEHMEQRAACAHSRPENSLGMHIRHSDKVTSRNVIPVSKFLPYCEAFVSNGGGSIYLATDSAVVVEEIMREWPEQVTSHIRQPAVEALSSNDTASFDLGVSKHRSNTEALTDALALSKCTYFLHGLSALSEAALFMNPDLVERSINLDDYEQGYNADYFVKVILQNGGRSALKDAI